MRHPIRLSDNILQAYADIKPRERFDQIKLAALVTRPYITRSYFSTGKGNQVKKKTLIALVLCSFGTHLRSQTMYIPPVAGTQWDTVSVQSLGWNAAAVAPLHAMLEAAHTRAFIVLKNGRIVMEKYFGTFTKDSLWYWASAGKSMTSVLVGIAKSEGRLALSDTTSKWLGKGWTSAPPEMEDKITIRHQLTMTTGLDDGVPDRDCTDRSCLLFKTDAGTRWAYHNAPYTLLDPVIERATGQSLNTYYLTRMRSKIGMNGFYFASGDYNNVLMTTPRSMARFGLLMLNRGVWDTTPILNDTAYFREMTTSSQTINPSYGYLWWLNGKTSYMLPTLQMVFPGSVSPAAPADMFAALGKNGQLINIVPSLGIVFIRMGDAPDGTFGSLVATVLNNQIWEKLTAVMGSTTGAAGRADASVVRDFSLSQNYPNPFNPRTTITFTVPAPGYARLTVFDMLGRETAVLYDGTAEPGVTHTALFDGGQRSSGMYEARLDYNGHRLSRKIVLVK